MKTFFLPAVLILVFCLAAFAQTDQTSSCPAISVSGGGVVESGEPMIFRAEVKGFDLEKLTFNWTVSNGTIIEGRGTPDIKVDTTGLSSSSITATVEIKGLSEGCGSIASETGSVSPVCGIPMMIDDYERIPFREEKARLDVVALKLEKNNDLMAVFFIYVTEKDSYQAVKTRIFNISKYLSETLKIPKERFNFVFGGITDIYRTIIYLPPVSSSLEFQNWEVSFEALKSKMPDKTVKKPVRKN